MTWIIIREGKSMAETNKVHNPKKTAVGIVTLRNEIYCSAVIPLDVKNNGSLD